MIRIQFELSLRQTNLGQTHPNYLSFYFCLISWFFVTLYFKPNVVVLDSVFSELILIHLFGTWVSLLLLTAFESNYCHVIRLQLERSI